MPEHKPRILIGIPCYRDVPAETLEDYWRLAYTLGRRYQEWDFWLAIKSKSEQFRARNAIVEAAIQCDARYLLFLDDDHVIDWQGTQPLTPEDAARTNYDFLAKLIGHMEADPKLGIIGALYYQRGGDCLPVLMKEGRDGGYYWMREDEITHGLQEVSVQGGGCMLLRMDVITRLSGPWFVPETDYGTDIQICKRVRDAGFRVCSDTSIALGHVRSQREVVTPSNRLRVASESRNGGGGQQSSLDASWAARSALSLYQLDAHEYLGVDHAGVLRLAAEYNEKNMPRFADYDDPSDYYRSLGPEQIARQVWFHHTEGCIEQMEVILSYIDGNRPAVGLDFGCGSAPVGYELCMRGHHLDFVDLDGTPAYEFLKWRCEKRKERLSYGFTIGERYHYALMLDSIEHLADWRAVLEVVIGRLDQNGVIVTNYFLNRDFDNPEHISMDQEAVRRFLVERKVYPINEILWIKRDLAQMEKAA